MFRSGAFVAEHVAPTTEVQVQPNGVDLTLGAVYEQREPGRIGLDGKEIGDRSRRSADVVGAGGGGSPSVDDGHEDDGAGGSDGDAYYLPEGSYVVEYGERVAVPEGHVGFIYPRSSLMRNSCMLHTAVWDAGYEGRGEGLLEVHHDVEIADGARIGQFVLARADHEGTYDGSYQGENL